MYTNFACKLYFYQLFFRVDKAANIQIGDEQMEIIHRFHPERKQVKIPAGSKIAFRY